MSEVSRTSGPAPISGVEFDPASARAWRAAGYWNDRLIIDYADEVAARAPGRVAYIDDERSIDYGTLQSLSYRLADAFLRCGLRPGEVVAVQLPNCVDYAVLHLALVRLGCVICLITPMSREREVGAMLRIGRARWFVVADVLRGFEHARLARKLRDEGGRRLELVVRGRAEPSEVSWEALVASGSDTAGARAAIDAMRPGPDDVTEIVFTSGTTGDAKGAIHTHNTLIAPMLAMQRSLRLAEGARMHVASTVAHQTAFHNGIRLPLQVGGSAVLQDRWSGDAFAELVERHRIEASSGSATFLLDLLRSEGVERRDLSSLRVFRCGGGPIPIGLVREAEARLPGLRVLRGWGQTENSVITITPYDAPLEVRAVCDGCVQPGMEIRVVDGRDRTVPDGTEGRLQVRGAFQSPAYANGPDLMRQSTTADGWFDTGDLAIRDAQGFIRISGRARDIIIRGGENIPVGAIENVLFEDPRIREVAIVGMPDERLGERACAFVILRPGRSLDLAAMRAFLDARGVAVQYWPERLEVVDDMPRTANGKVRKAALRESLAAPAAPDAPGR